MFLVLRDVVPQPVYPKLHDPLISTKKKEKKRSRNQVDEIKKIMSKLHHHCFIVYSGWLSSPKIQFNKSDSPNNIYNISLNGHKAG